MRVKEKSHKFTSIDVGNTFFHDEDTNKPGIEEKFLNLMRKSMEKSHLTST